MDYPSYLKHSRVVALSKEDGKMFPSYGAIRTISIASGLAKTWERVILNRLQTAIAETNPLDKAQTGFTKNKSTLTNLDRMAGFM